MGIFSKKEETSKPVELQSAGDLFLRALKTTSGIEHSHRAKYDIFSRYIAFRGVRDGLGTSLIVANTALALADSGLRVCVVDTSILAPVQDLYLKTDSRDKESRDVVDWFDLPFTEGNVLNTSRLNSSVSVLSFTNRTIVDLLSIHDTADLVELAFGQLDDKFDIVLIDVCNEPSTVATTAMQKAHILYQVWSNDAHSLEVVDSFITNCVTLSCALDKMRTVITSSVIDDLYTDWDILLHKYRFKRLSSIGLSLDIARVVASGKMIWGMSSENEDITEFNECIADICGRLLGLGEEKKTYGKLTVESVENARLEVTKAENVDELQDEHTTVGSNPTRLINNSVSDYMEDYEIAEDVTGTVDSSKPMRRSKRRG